MAEQYYEGIGRRKESTARVRISQGTGLFSVNEKELKEYFTRMGDANSILEPFISTGETQAQYDVSVKVQGGGVTGQTSAVQLGLARAFVKKNPDYISALRKDGLLTRDPRVKERKKPGLKRAPEGTNLYKTLEKLLTVLGYFAFQLPTSNIVGSIIFATSPKE